MSELNIVITVTQIDRVQFFDFLGITLDDDLSRNGHVNLVKNTIAKVILIGIHYRLIHAIPIDVIETIHFLVKSNIKERLLL